MNCNEFLDRVLERYKGAFDIYRPYEFCGKEYDAYAYFYSLSEKYVLVESANLWRTKSFEHTLFEVVSDVTPQMIADVRKVIASDMEEHMARGGEKYPPKDHMCSFLTYVIISENEVTKDAIKAIKRLSFDKGYMFNFRGHCQAHLVVVDMATEKVYTNRAGAQLRKIYEDTFLDPSDRKGESEARKRIELIKTIIN